MGIYAEPLEATLENPTIIATEVEQPDWEDGGSQRIFRISLEISVNYRVEADGWTHSEQQKCVGNLEDYTVRGPAMSEPDEAVTEFLAVHHATIAAWLREEWYATFTVDELSAVDWKTRIHSL